MSNDPTYDFIASWGAAEVADPPEAQKSEAAFDPDAYLVMQEMQKIQDTQIKNSVAPADPAKPCFCVFWDCFSLPETPSVEASIEMQHVRFLAAWAPDVTPS